MKPKIIEMLFSCDVIVHGYSDFQVTKLTKNLKAYHALFSDAENPMFSNVDPTLMGFKDPDLFKKDRENISYAGNDGTNDCEPSHVHIGSELKESSTCPWFTKMGYDQKRKPHIIHVVVCRCRKCAEGCCIEHFINVPVLRQYRGKFVPTVEPVSVACVCKYMSETDKQSHCGTGKIENETYPRKKRKRGKHRKKKNKSNITRWTTGELRWWRNKNCSYYRYCKRRG
ncbi:uncharacterized protein LOC132546731 [Ylistrum balloti]|uniref:uncharacterized protein LOC132546731 n=1 Tax=Ylistrum balloti TaxID=509963 RepID=UPI0029058A5B|nr:uncharacterized protein LOC132546731 [Ylistrum balloti]